MTPIAAAQPVRSLTRLIALPLPMLSAASVSLAPMFVVPTFAFKVTPPVPSAPVSVK